MTKKRDRSNRKQFNFEMDSTTTEALEKIAGKLAKDAAKRGEFPRSGYQSQAVRLAIIDYASRIAIVVVFILLSGCDQCGQPSQQPQQSQEMSCFKTGPTETTCIAPGVVCWTPDSGVVHCGFPVDGGTFDTNCGDEGQPCCEGLQSWVCKTGLQCTPPEGGIFTHTNRGLCITSTPSPNDGSTN